MNEITDFNKLLQEFAEVSSQTIRLVDEDKKITKSKTKRRREKTGSKLKSLRESYVEKMEQGLYEKLINKEILQFYRDVAEEQGYKYIPNYKIDLRNISLLQDKKRDFTKKEIITMIEFLYRSEQDYLDKRRLHVGILLTGWSNTIYKDSQDWVKGKYTNKPKFKTSKKKQALENREWTTKPVEKTVEDTEVVIGGGWSDD